jgi:hypothetical protein
LYYSSFVERDFKKTLASVLSALEAFLVLDGLGTDNHTRTTGPVVSIDRSGATKVIKKRHSLKLCLILQRLFWF